MVLLLLFASAFAAAGPTVEQLQRAGWFCIDPDGPDPALGLHCFKPNLNPITGYPATAPVMVFAPFTDEFIGTEILVRADVYGDQPCPQEGVSAYYQFSLPGGKYGACHH